MEHLRNYCIQFFPYPSIKCLVYRIAYLFIVDRCGDIINLVLPPALILVPLPPASRQVENVCRIMGLDIDTLNLISA